MILSSVNLTGSRFGFIIVNPLVAAFSRPEGGVARFGRPVAVKRIIESSSGTIVSACETAMEIVSSAGLGLFLLMMRNRFVSIQGVKRRKC